MRDMSLSHSGIAKDRGADGTEVPEYLQPPAGMSSELHNVNLCLTSLSLRIHANVRWFDKDDFDVTAARRTAGRLVASIDELQTLIARLHEKSTTMSGT
ncbi:hypothetical protein [Rhizobium sp. Root1220]|uniref:hypothetical protein n=1 Tax=Rhizobium sp. Root1220 TaxID=1736432 RepID=UPI0006F62D2F|nr:hypothetical protein [Rhizobium sp. Root1220]KQV78129.1 hypothetical protein ASC90_27115 [Rhizobium sp. Root1220]